MESKELTGLKHKLTDYTRFAMILVAISAFLYIGVLIQGGSLSAFKLDLVMAATYLFLATSFFFMFKVTQIKKQIQQHIDQ